MLDRRREIDLAFEKFVRRNLVLRLNMHLLVLVNDDVLVNHLRDIGVRDELRAVRTALVEPVELVSVLDLVLVEV